MLGSRITASWFVSWSNISSTPPASKAKNGMPFTCQEGRGKTQSQLQDCHVPMARGKPVFGATALKGQLSKDALVANCYFRLSTTGGCVIEHVGPKKMLLEDHEADNHLLIE